MKQIFKKTMLTTALSCLLSATAMANVVITEYVEGSSSNKAIEISNLGSAAVDLAADGYKLALYSNGSVDEGNTELLTGTLAPNASLVIYNSGADAEFIFDAPNGIASTVTFFNGDDAIVLTKADVVVDSFGRVGEDPGSAWTDENNADFSTANKTLRRLSSVTTGDTVIDDEFPGADNQWLTFDSNTADGLGCTGEALCSNDNTGGDPVAASILITEYIEGGGSNKAIEITNVSSADVDLGAGVYKLALYSNGSVDEGNTELLTGTLAPNASLVIYNSGADAEFIFEAPNGVASTVTFFNGDDAIVLTKADVVVDSFGRVGEDPGSAWTDANDANFSTANKTLRRLSSITTGDVVIDDAFPGTSNEWLTFDQDTSDGLGCPGEGICSNDNTGGGNPVNANVLITEYVEGGSNNKAFEISNLGTESVDLFTAGYRLEAFNNGNTDASNSENLIGILVPNSSIVIYNSGADDAFKKLAPQGIASNVTFINGDDALVLTVNGTIVDSLGRVGEDPGSAWTDPNNANFSTANKTLRRLSTVTTGDLIVDDVFPNTPNQWLTFDQDTSDGLGCPGEAACTGNEPLPLDGLSCPGEGICSSVYINRIAHAADTGDASTITLATLIGAGVTGATEENLEAYRAAIAASTAGELAELSQIQALVEAVNTNDTNNNMDAALLTCITRLYSEGVSAESVTSLICEGPGITSLTGIEQYLNLTELNLKDNQISDFSPLTDLVKLQTLNLENTSLSNVFVLRDMVNMTNLALKNNSISDVYPLENLVNMTNLDLRFNSIENIAPLRNMVDMIELRLSGNPLNSLLPLSKLSSLELITVSSGKYPSSDFLSIAPGLSSLNHVILRDNDITSIAGLELLTNLRELKLRGNNIVNLGPLLKDERLENIILIELTDNIDDEGKPLVDDEQLQELKRKYPGDIVKSNGSNAAISYDGHSGSDIKGSDHKCASDKYSPVIEVINKSGTRTVVNDSVARYKCANVGIDIAVEAGNGYIVKGFYDDSNDRTPTTIELKEIVFYLEQIPTSSVFGYIGDVPATFTVDTKKVLLTLTFTETNTFFKEGELIGEQTFTLDTADGNITPAIASFTTKIKDTEYTQKSE